MKLYFMRVGKSPSFHGGSINWVIENPFSDITQDWFVYTELYFTSGPHSLPSADLGFNSLLKLHTIFIKWVAPYISVTCSINFTSKILSLGHFTCHLEMLLASSIIKCTEDVILHITLKNPRTEVLAVSSCSATEQSCFQRWCQWATLKALKHS